MTRTVTQRRGRNRLSNEFQPAFEFASIHDMYRALAQIDDSRQGFGGGNGPSSEIPAFTVGTIEVYGQAGAQKHVWTKCTKTGKSMYFRNRMHVKGVLKLMKEHASEETIEQAAEEVSA